MVLPSAMGWSGLAPDGEQAAEAAAFSRMRNRSILYCSKVPDFAIEEGMRVHEGKSRRYEGACELHEHEPVQHEIRHEAAHRNVHRSAVCHSGERSTCVSCYTSHGYLGTSLMLATECEQVHRCACWMADD